MRKIVLLLSGVLVAFGYRTVLAHDQNHPDPAYIDNLAHRLESLFEQYDDDSLKEIDRLYSKTLTAGVEYSYAICDAGSARYLLLDPKQLKKAGLVIMKDTADSPAVLIDAAEWGKTCKGKDCPNAVGRFSVRDGYLLMATHQAVQHILLSRVDAKAQNLVASYCRETKACAPNGPGTVGKAELIKISYPQNQKCVVYPIENDEGGPVD